MDYHLMYVNEEKNEKSEEYIKIIISNEEKLYAIEKLIKIKYFQAFCSGNFVKENSCNIGSENFSMKHFDLMFQFLDNHDIKIEDIQDFVGFINCVDFFALSIENEYLQNVIDKMEDQNINFQLYEKWSTSSTSKLLKDFAILQINNITESFHRCIIEKLLSALSSYEKNGTKIAKLLNELFDQSIKLNDKTFLYLIETVVNKNLGPHIIYNYSNYYSNHTTKSTFPYCQLLLIYYSWLKSINNKRCILYCDLKCINVTNSVVSNITNLRRQFENDNISDNQRDDLRILLKNKILVTPRNSLQIKNEKDFVNFVWRMSMIAAIKIYGEYLKNIKVIWDIMEKNFEWFYEEESVVNTILCFSNQKQRIWLSKKLFEKNIDLSGEKNYKPKHQQLILNISKFSNHIYS